MISSRLRSRKVLAVACTLVGGLISITSMAAASAAEPASEAAPRFKLYVESDGAYRLTFQELVDAGLDPNLPGLDASRLGLFHQDTPIPIWVEHGGDGRLGPGDWIELIAEHLAGEVSYSSEVTRFNVYNLDTDVEKPARMTGLETVEIQPSTSERGPHPRSVQHLEQDQMFLRLPPKRGIPVEELWYWKKLVHIHRKPLTQTIDLSHLVLDADAGVHLRVGLRGWSRVRRKNNPDLADHALTLHLNGRVVGTQEWSGSDPFVFELRDIPADQLIRGENTLGLKVPVRMDGEKALIDVVMLNWIEVDYPHDGRIADQQAALIVPPGSESLHITHEPRAQEPQEAAEVDGSEPSRPHMLVFSRSGRRIAIEDNDRATIQVPGDAAAGSDGDTDHAEHRSFFATSSDRLASVSAVSLDKPSNWLRPDVQADYIMVTHSSLAAEVEPLAELHRSRGLSVVVVDIEDVYDETQGGIQDPKGLRDFVSYAYHHWQKPAPQYLLLVGDASWDSKNPWADDDHYADWTFRPWEIQRFAKNKSTPYAEGETLNHRNLIPTWNFTTHQGHSASDNYFVAVDGDDYLPDLAVGRLPVVTPEETRQIVEKIRTYMLEPEAGPWNRNALLITNENRSYQHRSDVLADWLSEEGFQPEKIYPLSSEESNAEHTESLINAFDQGQLFIHFLGHGGRYIWRTGPPDVKKNHDLFTLEDLDRLQPNRRLPIVLSMTCYSAPFDHPTADSIGEKLLRMDDRGAIAVLGASWRNSPAQRWSQALLHHLTQPGMTLGEGIRQAKHELKRRIFVETYNLMGDPAIPVPLPERPTAEPAPRCSGSILKILRPNPRVVVDIGLWAIQNQPEPALLKPAD